MSRLTKDVYELVESKAALWPGWLPLAVLPIVPFLWRADYPRWVFMWMLAIFVGMGCKWLAWWDEGRFLEAQPSRVVGYFAGWPGMNGREFLASRMIPSRPRLFEWAIVGLEMGLGAVLIWGVVRRIPVGHPLLTGWVGLLGLAFFLHFGLFHLLALIWQKRGVNAQPIMRAPLLACSVAEFWSRRWNIAFNELAHRFVFRPLAGRVKLPMACLVTFAVSGLVHDLVISVPAGGGYGRPTAYFIGQGLAVLFEHSQTGRRLGLRNGWRGWIFTIAVTAAPAGCVFHPPFINKIILPMLAAIGAT